ncbi:3-dehydroquinate synthase [Thalassoglobus neptunius]|uniref:3-dehydroquinate synthase n=1 Tax=Thalassoglobus neptunius TaxID=1938619 RepID=A0A5C5X3F8_9PLAN|nr:3-dehydroquinate synthase [Thalassoglobus neptunius]TWT56695.1 3-dehydroquinate synthase [Thalassoglobus neptunius]
MSAGSEQNESQNVHVRLGDRSYDIVIGKGILPQVEELVSTWLRLDSSTKGTRTVLIVTDSNVAEWANRVQGSFDASGWKTRVFEFAAGESSKKISTIIEAWDALVDFQADRRTVVISVGGGVVGDAGGFIAATYARGIPFIQIPTTLLATVDSAVGGKVGINHPKAKNLIGAFHQPCGVVIDTETLNTLPDREYRSGLAEVVKYGVILDEDFFSYLEQNVHSLNERAPHVLRMAIARSCELKAKVVEEDEFETTGLRAILNYGHTFAHAFEALAGYGELLHGEAVSIGMVYASRLAEKCGRTEQPETEKQVRLLESLDLPTNLSSPESIKMSDVLDRMRLDKKTVGGRLRFILPTRIGHVELIDDVDEAHVIETLREGGLSE